MPNNSTVLLTGTIKPHKYVKNNGYNSTSLDYKERLSQYLQTIIYYITESEFKNIVYCDNSNYEFGKSDINILYGLSKLYNKNLEIIPFIGNVSMIEKLGYGYGDGEIIDYAIDNSEIIKKLNETESFYKISGRYIYSNINEFIKKHYSYNNLFFKAIPAFFTVNTGIFKVSKDFYKKFLYDSKININPKLGGIEKLYYELLVNKKPKVGKIKILPIRSNLTWDNDIGSYNSSITKRRPIYIDHICRFLGIYNIHGIDSIMFNLFKKIIK